jgi:PPM family protein phosphatase
MKSPWVKVSSKSSVPDIKNPGDIMVYIRSASQTHPGKSRKNNEDFITFFEPEDPEILKKSGRIYIIADGVGGASKGEQASQYAAQKILHDYYAMEDLPIEQRLRVIFPQVSQEIYEYARGQDQYMQMATTAVVAVVHEGMLHIAHVGDSRAYLIRNGQVKQLTHDHNVVGELMRSGTLNEIEAMNFDGRNPLSRSLGGEPEVVADVSEPFKLMPGDKILLSSDGFTRYASREIIGGFINQGPPDDVVYKLVDFANNNGGQDNISVLVFEANDKPFLASNKRGGIAVGPEDRKTVYNQEYSFSSKGPKRSRTKWLMIPVGVVLFTLAAIAIVMIVNLFGIRDAIGRLVSGNGTINETEAPGEVFSGGNQEEGEMDELSMGPEGDPIPIVTQSSAMPPELSEIANTPDEDVQFPPTPSPTAAPSSTPSVTSTITPTPTENQPLGPDTMSYCEYAIDFTSLKSECTAYVGIQDCTYPDETKLEGDLYCILLCRFNDTIIAWEQTNGNAYEVFRDVYREKIININADYNPDDSNFHTVKNGWILGLPDIATEDCEEAGGSVFEPTTE